ncbi:MAG: putative lipid II flippase FtsW [Planctomycetota bacterium]|jgi:cell division protein FtsW|nr:putative lipid II flippase FtsW [Planctomycetota bacterium]
MMTDLTREEAIAERGYLAWQRTKLLMAVFALTGFGLVMVYSASPIRAARGGGWEIAYAHNQLWRLGIAVVAMSLLSMVPYRWWQKLWLPALFGGYAILGLVLTPLGTRVNGANRWFRTGAMNVQPSEVAKFTLVIAVSAILVTMAPEGKPRLFRHVIPLCILVGVAVFLVAIEPDFGTAALIGAALTALMLAGGVRVWQLSLLLLPVIPAAAWYGYTKFDHISRRIEDWMAGEAFHTNVSKLAIGSGGIWGMGLGQGPAKLDYLPEAHTDFIFAMVGQETGLIGTLSLITLFVIVIWQGLAIARNAPDRFGALLTFGVTAFIGGQAAFNMGVVTGVLPPKGISLPFVSFGGSGLVVFYSMIGLVVSVTRGTAIPGARSAATGLMAKYRPRPAFYDPPQAEGASV